MQEQWVIFLSFVFWFTLKTQTAAASGCRHFNNAQIQYTVYSKHMYVAFSTVYIHLRRTVANYKLRELFIDLYLKYESLIHPKWSTLSYVVLAYLKQSTFSNVVLENQIYCSELVWSTLPYVVTKICPSPCTIWCFWHWLC